MHEDKVCAMHQALDACINDVDSVASKLTNLNIDISTVTIRERKGTEPRQRQVIAFATARITFVGQSAYNL